MCPETGPPSGYEAGHAMSAIQSPRSQRSLPPVPWDSREAGEEMTLARIGGREQGGGGAIPIGAVLD